MDRNLGNYYWKQETVSIFGKCNGFIFQGFKVRKDHYNLTFCIIQDLALSFAYLEIGGQCIKVLAHKKRI